MKHLKKIVNGTVNGSFLEDIDIDFFNVKKTFDGKLTNINDSS